MYLEDRVQAFVLLDGRGVGCLGVAQFLGVGEEGVFDFGEACWRRLLVARGAHRWHVGLLKRCLCVFYGCS